MAKRFRDNVYMERLTSSKIGVAAVTGVLVGFLGWALNALLLNYVFMPLFCGSNSATCASSPVWTWWIGMIILSVAGLLAMVSGKVYRPLLVVIAALVTVWGIWVWLGVFAWWQAGLWQALIFGLAYALYALLAKIDNFALSVLAMVVAIIIVRLVSLLA